MIHFKLFSCYLLFWFFISLKDNVSVSFETLIFEFNVFRLANCATTTGVFIFNSCTHTRVCVMCVGRKVHAYLQIVVAEQSEKRWAAIK